MRLDVSLGPVHVGTLALEYGDRSAFRFAASYLEAAERPTLGRFFEDHLQPDWEYSRPQSRLPSFFQNYLPEEFSALRELIARRAGVKPHREFALLGVLGGDLPGAIVVRPEGEEDGGDADSDRPPDGPLDPAGPLRFSLAGVQLKFSVVRNETRFTLPASGRGGHWIVKLPDRDHIDVPRNEHAMLTWARACGIAVPDFELVEVASIEGLPTELSFKESHALAIRRYDRTPSGRVHQEDFAQVLDVPARDRYEGGNFETIARIVRTVCGDEDFEQLIRRYVFMVLSGNGDAHLKNWSFVYPDGKRARLSPAYDLVCTAAYPDVDATLALRLGKNRVFQDVRLLHFERLATKVGADPDAVASLVRATADAIRTTWPAVRASVPLAADVAAAVERHLASVQLGQ